MARLRLRARLNENGWRVRIERIICASRECLSSFIARNIRSGSTVHTDSFKSYLDIPKYGCRHFRVNHFLTFKDSKSGACTNIIENVWAVMRRIRQSFINKKTKNMQISGKETRQRHLDYIRTVIRECNVKSII